MPLLPGALDYVGRNQLPGGLHRNRARYQSKGVIVGESIDASLATLLYDPQTAGGLLFSIGSDEVASFARAFAAAGQPVWEIGHVTAGDGVRVEP